MSDIAIKVENLGKMYRIGAEEQRPDGLWDATKQAVLSPFDYLRRITRPPTEEETLWALKDVSFQVERGEVVGIIGRNGAGKSTLLKVLSRITEPTEGRAVINGRVGSLLEVGTGFHPELTGRENIYLNGAILGMTKDEIDRKFDEIVDFSGVEKFIDTPVKRYSSGMRVRLAFSVAAHLDPEILLIDEVLAVGDAAFQKKCLGKMGDVAESGRTVLFVSHNMTAIQNLCPTTIFLESGKAIFRGDTQYAIERYMQSISNRSAASSLADREDRRGNQLLRFTKVEVCDAEGNQIDRVLSGQDILIRCHYISSQELQEAKVHVAIGVADTYGQIISNLNSRDSGYSNLDVYKRGAFECEWPNFNLMPGSYKCILFCSVNGEVVDWIESAFSIQVEKGDFFDSGKLASRHGSVLVPHTWSSHKEL
jgi:lipopolysaccharide transport system ATP-binding protein